MRTLMRVLPSPCVVCSGQFVRPSTGRVECVSYLHPCEARRLLGPTDLASDHWRRILFSARRTRKKIPPAETRFKPILSGSGMRLKKTAGEPASEPAWMPARKGLAILRKNPERRANEGAPSGFPLASGFVRRIDTPLGGA